MGGLRLHVAGGNGFPHKHDSGCMAAHGALPGGEPQKEAISSCIHTLVRRPSHLYLGRHRHVTRNAPSCSGEAVGVAPLAAPATSHAPPLLPVGKPSRWPPWRPSCSTSRFSRLFSFRVGGPSSSTS